MSNSTLVFSAYFERDTVLLEKVFPMNISDHRADIEDTSISSLFSLTILDSYSYGKRRKVVYRIRLLAPIHKTGWNVKDVLCLVIELA